ncbi:hypothetical protein ACFU5Y_12285 [Streptomyces gardneri]|uniref:hypothetical protein n=1 Tax=Streptomyces gardneri TaxID=66892 RepID=UPI0036ACFA9F
MREHDRPEQAGGGSDAPPVYPGESTEIRGRDSEPGPEAESEPDAATDPDTEAPAETGAHADADAEVDADTRAETHTETESRTEGDRELSADTARTDEESGPESETPRLLDSADEEAFRTRWHEIQNRFVDDPRGAVHEADDLVTDVTRQLAATFADRRKDLEGQWNEGEDVDTERLRMALRQYRSFFNRLLTT